MKRIKNFVSLNRDQKLFPQIINKYYRLVKGVGLWSNFQIETTALCNRDCCFCPRWGDRSGVRKDSDNKKITKKMSKEQVCNLVDQAVDLGYQGKISFHRLSEPFLHPDYVEFAKYTKNKGLLLVEHTNGDILFQNERLRKEIDGLIDVLKIGLYDYKNYDELEKYKKFWLNQFNRTKVSFSTPWENLFLRNKTVFSEQNVIV